MRTLGFLVFLFLNISGQLWAQDIESINKQGLEKLLAKETDTVYVLNFWATWCSPCVAEIGYFEELHKSATDRKLKVVLINLDFPKHIEEQVKPFILERNLTAPVLNMRDLDYNSWIPLVDRNWTGAIPATLIYKKDKRRFIEAALTKDELFDVIDNF